MPYKVPGSYHARPNRPLDTTFAREARLTPRRPRAERKLPEVDEEPPLHMPRSLDHQFLRDPPAAPRGLGRLAVLGGLAIAALIGAATIALFVTGKLPSEPNKMLGLSADNAAVAPKLAGDTLETPEQASSGAARAPTTSTKPPPIGEDSSRAASVRDATERASVR